MTEIYDRIIEEIYSARNDNKNINRIKLSHEAYDELINSQRIVTKNTDRVSTEIAGVDVTRDPLVDRIEVEKEEQNYAYSRGKCLLCSRQMMYDENNSEYYCPICKI